MNIGDKVMRLFTAALRRSQWKSHLSFTFCTASSLESGMIMFGQPYPAVGVSSGTAVCGKVGGYKLNREVTGTQWKPNLSFTFCTSSSLGSGMTMLGQTYPAVGVSSGPAVCREVGGYKLIREGEAEILMPSCNTVFYNKAQVNNRDISIAVLRTFISRCKEEYMAKFGINERFKNEVQEGNEGRQKSRRTYSPIVLEALAASGLRAIRYAREVDEIGQVLAIDNDKASIEICKKNIQLNGSGTRSKVAAHLCDARVYMLTHPKEFDAVDLDPYGSPSVFLDSAVQTVADGGLLMCTATDLAVLCGEDGDVCYSRYGSYPLKGKYCHEMALRILLACIESHANRYKRFIVPILSVYMDYYIRVFVRIYTSPKVMKRTTLKLAYIYQCIGCDSFHLQSIGRSYSKNNVERYGPAFGPVIPQACSDCGRHFTVGGPIWSDPMHDGGWVQSILEDVKSMKEKYPAYDRICSVLTSVSEELSDVPLFLSLHNLCGTLKCTTPSTSAFHSVLSNAGYHISGTHVNPLGFKSNAPMHVIWDIMRCWIKDHPLKSQPAGEPGTIILAKEPALLVDFSQAASHSSRTRAKKAARFMPNPERNWGPKLRAGRLVKLKHVSFLDHHQIEEVCNEDGHKPNSLEINT